MSKEQMIKEIRSLVESGQAETYEYIDKNDGEVVTIYNFSTFRDIVFVQYSAFPSGEEGEFSLNGCQEDYLKDVYNAIFSGKRDKNMF